VLYVLPAHLEIVDLKVNQVVLVFLVIQAIQDYLEDLENLAELVLLDLLANLGSQVNLALKGHLEMIQLVEQVSIIFILTIKINSFLQV
jgi:hypothetical protein